MIKEQYYASCAFAIAFTFSVIVSARDPSAKLCAVATLGLLALASYAGAAAETWAKDANTRPIAGYAFGVSLTLTALGAAFGVGALAALVR